MLSDLLCQSCGEQESSFLVYYRRYYPEIQNPAIVDPLIICQTCQTKLSENQCYDTRQQVFYSFSDIQEMPDKARGMLTSLKGTTFNALNSKFWKKKIFRIAYRGGGKNRVKFD